MTTTGAERGDRLELFVSHSPEPGTCRAAAARMIELLAAAYRERRVSLIALIYERPPEGGRAFAGAFRPKKIK